MNKDTSQSTSTKCILTTLFLLLAITSAGLADTTWVNSGNVSGVWGTAGSPYMIYQGNVTVPRGAVLTIQPGVKIYFSGAYSMFVNELLHAVGTSIDSIRFTTDTLQNPQGWRGIRFNHANPNCLLEYCIFENGRANGANEYRYGGAIALDSSAVTIRRCIFRDNRARIDGGAIFTTLYSQLSLSGCILSRNATMFGSGGGVYGMERSQLTIKDCSFLNNSAELDGGAIKIGDLSDGTITRCLISENTSFHGGGVSKTSGQVSLLLTSSILDHNTAAVGGAIYCEQRGTTIRACTFWSNAATDGGSIYLADSTAIISNCIIAFSQIGHGITFQNAQRAQVNNTDFYQNVWGDFGGTTPAGLGILALVNIRNDSCDNRANIFTDPVFADTNLRDVHLLPESPAVSAGRSDTISTDFAGSVRANPPCSPPDMGALESNVSAPYTYLCGSMSGIIGPDTFLIGSPLTVNTGQTLMIMPGTQMRFFGAGKLRVLGLLRAIGTPEDTIVFTHGLSNDTSRWGRIRFENAHDSCRMEYCLVEWGNAKGQEMDSIGGGVYCSGTDATFTHCSFRNNLAYRGGSVSASNCNATWRDCDISHNRASSGGGAYCNSASHPRFVNCIFRDNNESIWCGGGLQIEGPQTSVTLDSCTIRNNHISGEGSAIYLSSASVILNQCLVENNLTPDWGTIYVSSSTATLHDCNIRNNSASAGSAVFCWWDAHLLITESMILSNTSHDWYGGAMSIRRSTCNMSDCILRGNHELDGPGGGIYCEENTGDLQFTRCIIDSNSAESNDSWANQGGGIYSHNSAPRFYQCTISANSCASGSGVYAEQSSPAFENCTLDGNYGAVDGGIAIKQSTLTLKNSIVSHTVGSGIYFEGQSSGSALNYCDFYGNSGGNFSYALNDTACGPTGLGRLTMRNFRGDSCDSRFNILLNPRFSDTTTSDYHLQATSACINTGDWANTFDPDSTIRDIGAYYYPLTGLPPTVFNLIRPLAGEITDSTTILMSWSKSHTASSGADLSLYHFEISLDSSFTLLLSEIMTGDTSYILNGLRDERRYWWRVWGLDSNGTRRFSTETRSFRTHHNDRATPFQLLLPGNGDTLYATRMYTFQWQVSSDPDPGDSVMYNLYVMAHDSVASFMNLRPAGVNVLVPALGLGNTGEFTWWVVAHSFLPDTTTESDNRFHFTLIDTSTNSIGLIAPPTQYALTGIYPNPFNSELTIAYGIPKEGTIRLAISNILGQRVATLVDGNQSPGWYQIRWTSESHGSGIYYITLEGPEIRSIRKVVQLK